MDARTSSLKTPHHYAGLDDRYEFPFFLLINGASVDARDTYKMTPRHHAAGIGHFVVVRLLLDRKADLRAKNHNGKTPLRLSHDDIEKAHAATRSCVKERGSALPRLRKIIFGTDLLSFLLISEIMRRFTARETWRSC